MKVNEQNLGPLGGLNSTGVSKSSQPGNASPSTGAHPPAQGDAADGVQLSGLAQRLNSLTAESPEREAHIEQIARAYAQGAYQVDAEATAAGIIDDALRYSENS